MKPFALSALSALALAFAIGCGGSHKTVDTDTTQKVDDGELETTTTTVVRDEDGEVEEVEKSTEETDLD